MSKFHLTDSELSILKSLLNRKIFSIISNGIRIESDGFWNTELSLDYCNKKIQSPEFQPFVTIEADYKLSNKSTTYFEFNIQENKTPPGIQRDADSSLLWPFSELFINTRTLSKITIFQDWNEEDERVDFDRLILFEAGDTAFSIEATDSVTGGVTLRTDRQAIERITNELAKRIEI
ncbi:hypothetical protein [Marinoscillum sp.]|uniref:hypothetical protein n=1 Tax=Marinoscillum sp. TaxID=2024838 RepID=UPI003BAA6AC1